MARFQITYADTLPKHKWEALKRCNASGRKQKRNIRKKDQKKKQMSPYTCITWQALANIPAHHVAQCHVPMFPVYLTHCAYQIWSSGGHLAVACAPHILREIAIPTNFQNCQCACSCSGYLIGVYLKPLLPLQPLLACQWNSPYPHPNAGSLDPVSR